MPCRWSFRREPRLETYDHVAEAGQRAGDRQVCERKRFRAQQVPQERQTDTGCLEAPGHAQLRPAVNQEHHGLPGPARLPGPHAGHQGHGGDPVPVPPKPSSVTSTVAGSVAFARWALLDSSAT